MAFKFGENLSFCFVGDRTVALDLRRDRYFGVGPDQTVMLRGALDGGGKQDLADQLIRLGLASPGQRETTVVALRANLARTSAHEDHHGRTGATVLDVLEVAGLVLSVHNALRRAPLARIIDRVRTRRVALPSPGDDDEAFAQLAARRFLAVRIFTPIEPICLLDSLALITYLARRGVSADLVLGVDLDPFEAHAWVQHGDCALNETTHRAAMLTPILVV